MQIITRQEAIAQGLKRYFTGEPCKYGHIAERQCSNSTCFACAAARKKAYYEANPEGTAARRKAHYEANREEIAATKKAYREANPEEERARKKAYYEANREKVAASQKAYREANREKHLARKKAYYEANREEVAAREKVYLAANKEKVAARRKAYYEANREEVIARAMAYVANNPQAKAATNLRTRIGDALRAANATKSARTLELLGASIEEVRAHLEAQFKLGMTWDNWSIHGWHIDHIKPCASFDLTDPEQQKACFHYSNLQPLWAKDNLSKNDRLDWVPAKA